jgi:hypothetical protein
MTTRALLFVLGVVLGMLIFGRPHTSPTRRLYQTVKAAERDGIDSFGSELGSL